MCYFFILYYNISMENIENLNSAVETATTSDTTVTKTASKTVSKTKSQAVESAFSGVENISENQLAANQTFNETAGRAIALSIVGELPTAKFLVQKFDNADSSTLTDQFLGKIFPEMEFVDVGEGIEYELTLDKCVNTLDETQFIPTERQDIDNQTKFDSISIPDVIYTSELSIAPWKYVKYYLSGKIDEQIEKVKEKLDVALNHKVNQTKIELLRTIFRTTHAKTSSTTDIPTNRLVGDNTLAFIDALKESKDFFFGMLSPNTQFNYNDTYDGYNSSIEGNRVYIMDYKTRNNLAKIATTFLAKDQLETYADAGNIATMPNTYYIPTNVDNKIEGVGQIVPMDIFTDTAGNYVEGVIMAIDTRFLKCLMNYSGTYSAFYPKNATSQLFRQLRYTVGILKWAQVAVYENTALLQEFIVPVE